MAYTVTSAQVSARRQRSGTRLERSFATPEAAFAAGGPRDRSGTLGVGRSGVPDSWPWRNAHLRGSPVLL